MGGLSDASAVEGPKTALTVKEKGISTMTDQLSPCPGWENNSEYELLGQAKSKLFDEIGRLRREAQ